MTTTTTYQYAAVLSMALMLLFCHTRCTAQADLRSDAERKRVIDSMLIDIGKAKEDTAKVLSLVRLCWHFVTDGKFDKALECGNEAYALAGKLNFVRGQGSALTNIGIAWERKGNYPEALRKYNDALAIKIAARDSLGMTSAYSNIGVVNRHLGNYPEAARNYFEALKIAEALRDQKSLGICYNNLGNVYFSQGNYDEALKNYFVALKIRTKIEDRIGTGYTFNNIGITYEKLENYPEAIKNHLLGLRIKLEVGEKRAIASSQSNLGNVYSLMGDHPSALKYYSDALEIREEIGDKVGISHTLANMARIYTRQNRFAEARKYLDRALQLGLEIKDKMGLRDTYQVFAGLYEEMKEHRKAFTHYQLYIAYRDSLSNEENTKKTIQAQMQYDFDKQQAADSIRNAETVKQEALKHEQEVARQRTYTYGGIIGFVLMMVVAGVSFRAFRQKQKANAVIWQQKQLVEEKQKEVLDSIHYARRIQQSLLPSERYIEKCLQKIAQ